MRRRRVDLVDVVIPTGLAIRAWRVLSERSAFNECIAIFELNSGEGDPDFQLLLAMAPNKYPPPILRAWQIMPGQGSASVSPERVPYTIRDLAQTACEQISRQPPSKAPAAPPPRRPTRRP